MLSSKNKDLQKSYSFIVSLILVYLYTSNPVFPLRIGLDLLLVCSTATRAEQHGLRVDNSFWTVIFLNLIKLTIQLNP